MSPEPTRRLIQGRSRCGKTSTLPEKAVELVDAGYAPVHMLALSVHRPAVRGLRTALHGRVGQDVPTADVRRFATSLLERYPERVGLPPGWTSSEVISALDRRMLMRRAWARVADGLSSLYARHGTQPGALDWIARVFDAFSEWSGTADPARLPELQPVDPALAELWAAYRQYLRLSTEQGLVAFQEVVPRAIDVLRDPVVHGAVAPAALLLDDLDQFRPSELLLARALIGPGTAVLASASSRVDDPHTRFLQRWLHDLGLCEAPATPADIPDTTSVQVAEYPTPRHESAAIAQHIATTFPVGGRFSDYAVVAFDPELVVLLRRTLPEWGIAVEGMEARTAYTLPLAPLLRTGMRLISGAPVQSDDLIALLRHPALGVPPADARICAAALAERASGIDGSAPPFGERHWPSDLSHDGRSRLRRLFSVSDALARVDLASSAKLRRWIDELGLRKEIARHNTIALDPWAVSADEVLLAHWLGFLERTERIRRQLGEPLSDSEAVEVLEASQGLVEPASRPLRDAVQIWSPEQLGGCSAKTVWLAGLGEPFLPPPATALPWAEPEAFAAAFAALPGCIPPERDDRAGRWGKALLTLHNAASRGGEQLVLSWSAADRRGQRRLPSPVLDALFAELALAGTRPQPMQAEGPAISVPPRCKPLLLPSGSSPAFSVAQLPPVEHFSTSASAIEDFLACPRRHFYGRVLGLYDVVSSPRQALGQVVHAALNDSKQIDDAVPDAAALVDEHWPRRTSRFGTPVREAAYRRLAEQAVAEVVAVDAEDAVATFVGAEVVFHWQIAPDVELRGSVDRIDRRPDGLVVLDYKLGKDSPSINELLRKFAPPRDEDAAVPWRPSDLQLPLYALAVENGSLDDQSLVGERVAEVSLVYPLLLRSATGKPASVGRRTIRIVEHTEACAGCCAPSERAPKLGYLCREQLDAIKARALMAIEEMRAGNIEPDPRDGADTCRSCAFRAICPAAQA